MLIRTKYLITLILLCSLEAAAQGGLTVTPKRIIFSDNQQVSELYLMNQTGISQTYSVNFIEYFMEPEGTLKRINDPEPGHFFASEHIRFFPRRVTLGPGESQTLRLQLRRPRDEEPKEYRSHIVFQNIPAPQPLGKQNDNDNTEGVSIRIDAIFGISIPVIFRTGEFNSEVRIVEATLIREDNDQPVLDVILQRSGEHSAYGDFSVLYENANNQRFNVSSAKGVAVYTPTESRRYRLKFNNPEQIDFNEGKFFVRYIYNQDFRTRDSKVAEYELILY